MRRKSKLFVLIILSILIQTCQEEDFDEIDDIDNQNNTSLKDLNFQSANFGSAVSGDFIGTIKDEQGNQIENATISIGNKIASTDRNGIFVLNDADVFENFAYVKAEKQGYINGSRVLIPSAQGINRVEIVLLKKEVSSTINSGESSTVNGPGGVKIDFIGDFIDENGNPYSGQVEVDINYLYPNFPSSTFLRMPGNLFAQTQDNDAVGLETYGMVSVNLTSPNGEILNINENSPATVELPVSFNQVDIAPDTIKLWYFDETVGYWKEEGVADKIENKYVAEVTHFSWWNCDIPFEGINLCFSINSSTTNDETPYLVQITRSLNNQVVFYGYAYSGDDLTCGLVPVNEEIIVSIFATGFDCSGELLHEQTFGGFSSDESINVSFSSPEIVTTTILGNVNSCNGSPLTSGYLYLNGDNVFAITDGVIDLEVESCDSYSQAIQIFDSVNGQWSVIEVFFLNGDTINLETISTCDDSGGIFNGDVLLRSQAEVNSFGSFSFTGIAGDLRIVDNQDETSDIVDLSPLSSLTNIDESLFITNNTELETLNGLNNLVTVGNVWIIGNPILSSLTGLSSLTNINSNFILENNISINSLSGLENLNNLGLFYIHDMTNLTSIANLVNLNSAMDIWIDSNDSLIDLTGLEQIQELSTLLVGGNESLQSLNGLQNLLNITPTSDFFRPLTIGLTWEFDIYGSGPNPNLNDLCALENLFVNGNGMQLSEEEIYIENNAYNPSPLDLFNGNCSQ